MKLIHCADVHLASALETSLSPDRAKQRRGEILLTFADLIRYAVQNGVRAVLIAGDLFDANDVPARSVERVFSLMQNAPNVDFYYLRGNHDGAFLPPCPPNVAIVPRDGQWLVHRYDDATLAFCDPPAEDEDYPSRLILRKEERNIVCLHGQLVTGGKTRGEQINLRDFAGKNIDYMALGHVHDYRQFPIDARGRAVYSGCLEGRGFDECGQKGFVLLNADAGGIAHEFIPFAKRTLHEISADISNAQSAQDVEKIVNAAVEPIDARDMVALHLCGAVSADVPLEKDYLLSALRMRFFAARLYDDTRLAIDAADYADDLSLKGAFVRLVLESDLDEAEKKRVLACGLGAIGGEVSF